jgi:succinate dehydrogenase / fumarate reductase flavoprotein subunit
MALEVERHEFDVLVIGAGGAGLRAAIAAAEAGARTALVCRSLLGKAHTVMAEGGVAAALGNVAPEDGWETHFQDTMFSAKYLNNWRMAELHAKEAPDRVRELEHWGAVFDRTPDRKMSQRAFGGHTHKRLVHIGDRTGLEMIRTLQDKAVHSGIEVFMECTITRLLKDGERVVGAFGYRRGSGEFLAFAAPAVVLGTGGGGRSYRITSNSWECFGDGYALAYDAGAELVDMEFVQFHPTGMVYPPGVVGLLVTEAVRGEGGILRNRDGERFMSNYDERRMELSTRDVVARAIFTEVKEDRGTEHGGVFLDVSHLPDTTVRQKLPSMYDQFMELAGVDITKQPMEVGPTCHYFMGGVRIDGDTGHSPVAGLLATGECSGGMNGANRLGGNSLSDLLVFGRRAGEGAAEAAARADRISLQDVGLEEAAQEMLDYLEGQGTENPYQIHDDLRDMMQANVGIFRDKPGLEDAVSKLDELDQRACRVAAPASTRVYNPGWHLCRDLQTMLTVSRAVTLAALRREESRGAHSRLDHTGFDDYWGEHNIVITREGGEMRLVDEPVRKRAELEHLVQQRQEQEQQATSKANTP